MICYNVCPNCGQYMYETRGCAICPRCGVFFDGEDLFPFDVLISSTGEQYFVNAPEGQTLNTDAEA